MTDTLRRKMQQEFADKQIFDQAQQYAFDYLDNAAERNVFPTSAALDDLASFVEDLPDAPGEARSILAQLHDCGSPGTVSQIAGRYFGFVNGGVIPTALAARWLTDFWDQNSALYTMSPVVSQLESVTEAWVRDLLGLPERVVAGFVSGSSMAIFCGLAAGRYRILNRHGWDINRQGLIDAPRIRIITGRHTHAAVTKAIGLLGFGTDHIEWMDTDDQGRVLTSSALSFDENTILILQAGNVNSGAFDEFEGLCQQAREAGAWVHIDGAFGLWAAASSRLRHLTKGIELANSWSVDGHKTLNTPYDSGLVLCDDSEALVKALQSSGAYLPSSEHKDGMHFTPEMSRRARVAEMWATLKYLGRSGVDDLIYGFHERAVQFSEELRSHGFQVLNDVVFNQVIVACDDDTITNQTLSLIQQSGECWVGGSSWFGKAVIRISVCSWVTSEEDVSRSVRAFVAARDKANQ